MKKEPKLTPWFPADVKPVRAGIYQRNYGGRGAFEDVVYAFWDGVQFFTFGETIAEAIHKDRKPSLNFAQWRGLAEKL